MELHFLFSRDVRMPPCDTSEKIAEASKEDCRRPSKYLYSKIRRYSDLEVRKNTWMLWDESISSIQPLVKLLGVQQVMVVGFISNRIEKSFGLFVKNFNSLMPGGNKKVTHT